MKAIHAEQLIIGDVSPAVRITTDDGKTYVFILEWQKLLANDIDAALVCDELGDSYPINSVKMPRGFSHVADAQWIQDPTICRIVRDALLDCRKGPYQPQEIPVAKYYGKQA